MKRAPLVLIAAAGLTSLWLWYHQNQINERRAALSAQIARDKALFLAATAASPASATAGKPGGNVPEKPADPLLAGATPLSLTEFTDLAAEITRLETVTRTEANQELMRVKVTEVFTRLSVTSVEELKRILDELPGLKLSADGQSQITSAIMGLLAKSDPPAAAAYALERNARPGTLESALHGWAKLDAAAAARWLDAAEAAQKLPSNVTADQLRLILLPRQIAADPSGDAAEKIAKLQAANLGDTFAETVRLLNTPEQRRAFLTKLTSVSGMPPETIGQYLYQVSRESSITAAAGLLKEAGPALPEDQFNKIAAAAATARIDATTPAQADWLLQNLRGSDRAPAITQLMQAWTQADYNAAATWLKNQPPSADHDTAIAAFAPLVAGKEPPSAVDWALTIRDTARKTEVLASIYRDWQAREPDQAAAYFLEKGLTSFR